MPKGLITLVLGFVVFALGGFGYLAFFMAYGIFEQAPFWAEAAALGLPICGIGILFVAVLQLMTSLAPKRPELHDSD